MSERPATVSELMNIYREALTGLTPALDRSGCPWRRRYGEAEELEGIYDGWDDLKQEVFWAVLTSPLSAAVEEVVGLWAPRSLDTLPEASNRIEVTDPQTGWNRPLVFWDLECGDQPFDTVLAFPLVEPKELKPVRLSFDGALWRARMELEERGVQHLEAL